jgi:hypothetical protein
MRQAECRVGHRRPERDDGFSQRTIAGGCESGLSIGAVSVHPRPEKGKKNEAAQRPEPRMSAESRHVLKIYWNGASM